MTIKEKRDILIWEMELLLLRAKAEKRTFTYEENRKFSESEQEVKGLNNVINAETRLIELRYNPYHDPTNGRFTSGNFSSSAIRFSGGGASGVDKSEKGDIIKENKPLGYASQSDKALKSGIKSEQKQIDKHKEKISNPQNYISDWDKKSDFYKNGVIKHWKKEIKNFEKQIQFRQEELDRRRK